VHLNHKTRRRKIAWCALRVLLGKEKTRLEV
jgi:hypothetical protein